MNHRDFEKAGLENLAIMEETGFLKKQGYSKGSFLKVMGVILGFLLVGVIGFGVYQIYDGKFQFNANPNILCEGSEISCTEQICNCNMTCPNINVTINQVIPLANG